MRRNLFLLLSAIVILATLGLLTANHLQRKEGSVSAIAQGNPDSEADEFQRTLFEFAQLREDLSVVQEQAFQTPEVQKAFDNFQQQLLSRMKEIDPEVDKKIERLEELGRKLEEMQGEMEEPGGL